VVAIVSALPEVAEPTSYRTPALKVAGKSFARLRSEAEGGLVLMCGLVEPQLRELIEEAWRSKAPPELAVSGRELAVPVAELVTPVRELAAIAPSTRSAASRRPPRRTTRP
jgi:hypothetical protein